MLYWLLRRILLGPLIRVLYKPWVKGLENIPTKGPAILASNHLSFSDHFFLPLHVDRKITFLAKAEYFNGRGIKGWLTASFFRGVGQIPIERSGGRASEAALRTGMKVLDKGELLGIYPEGTRSPDGRLYRGRTGVARMALESGIPVIPVAMISTFEVQPPGRLIPRLLPKGQVGVVIGEPLDFSRYEGMSTDRFVLRSVTDEIMYQLMVLSNQEYVDIYAATMKERLASARRSGAETGLPSGHAELSVTPGGHAATPSPAGESDAVSPAEADPDKGKKKAEDGDAA
ncbi:lysophospholipid acyltransferase family protein [Kineosporia babensis]|uniref:1-acyl-sn-glycerol-3-phosphate acyltransferase n=1 Tax=Kineosporia babensis TaxID=499548 RepID=A0A9X1STN8_9ACTN|nr:lysophospholipid acyltransferase family protein [Kineosporia babensis]MCD5311516.1 1-acyl-sn-glycerol-3-phosphate acyltransferase [Kineosporia babensis]